MKSPQTYRQKVEALVASHRRAVARVSEEEDALEAAAAELKAASEAQGIAQNLAQRVQQSVHDRIARVVSRCLAAVFEEPYEFTITFERKRGKTEAVLGFTRAGQAVSPRGGSGGGPVHVAAFALRVACLVLQRPRPRPVLCLDEPFGFVDSQNLKRVRVMLDTLAEELGVQFIIVTHEAELQAGTVIEIR